MTDQPGRDAQRIGDLGEAQFRLWAIEAHAVASRVENDQHGWDFIVELSRGSLTAGGGALDLMPCELHCFVQVKTITSPDSRVQIALSNWNRMVKDPVPWFVMVIVLNDEERACDAYLVHVDEAWCGRVLKRLRELPESEAQSLHHRMLEVSWNDQQRFTRLHGKSLEIGIRFHVGADLPSYTKRKHRWITESGYEADSHVVHLALAATEEDEANRQRAEFAVGVAPILHLAAIRAEVVRFGITKLVHESKGEGCTLELIDRQPDFRAVVTFARSDHTRSVELACEGYAAEAVFSDLPEGFRFRRLVGKLFSALVRFERSPDLAPDQLVVAFEWKFTSPEIDERVTLRDLGVAAQAALLMHGSLAEPIKMRMEGGLAFSKHDVSLDAGIDPDSLHYWTMVDFAARLASRFRLSPDTAVDANVLVAQSEGLRFLASSMDAPNKTARFRTDVRMLERATLPEAERAAVISAPYVIVDKHVVCFCVALVGVPVWSALPEGRHRLEISGSTRILEELCVPVDEWDGFDLNGVFEGLRTTLNAENIPFVINAMQMKSDTNQALV